MTLKIQISQFFFTKMNLNNGNKIKPAIFLWDIFKLTSYIFSSKKIESILMTFKMKISQFYG